MEMWWLLVPTFALAGAAIYYFLEARVQKGTNKALEDYKELFIEADALQKEGQSRVERLLRELGIKNVQLEKSAEIFKQSATKDEEIEGLRAAIEFQGTQYDKLFNQKKSSEVRVGKVVEQLAPFLENYPFDPKGAKFIGDPVDFCHFMDDKVVFVEVKSGESKLSTKQRRIRDLIKAGKVEFVVYRVRGEK